MGPGTSQKLMGNGTIMFVAEARRLLAAGLARRAIETCKYGLARYPDHSAGYVVLAAAYRAVGEHERARRVLSRGFEITGLEGLRELAEQRPEQSAEDALTHELTDTEAPDIAIATPMLGATAAPSETPTNELTGAEAPDIAIATQMRGATAAPSETPTVGATPAGSVPTESTAPRTIGSAADAAVKESPIPTEIEPPSPAGPVEVGTASSDDAVAIETPSLEAAIEVETPSLDDEIALERAEGEPIASEPFGSELAAIDAGDSTPVAGQSRPPNRSTDQQPEAQEPIPPESAPQRTEPPQIASHQSARELQAREPEPTPRVPAPAASTAIPEMMPADEAQVLETPVDVSGHRSIEASAPEEPDVDASSPLELVEERADETSEPPQATAAADRPLERVPWFHHRGPRTMEPARPSTLALHSGKSAHRLRSANLRLIPGLEFAPLRAEEQTRRMMIAPIMEEPMPEWEPRRRTVSFENAPPLPEYPPINQTATLSGVQASSEQPEIPADAAAAIVDSQVMKGASSPPSRIEASSVVEAEPVAFAKSEFARSLSSSLGPSAGRADVEDTQADQSKEFSREDTSDTSELDALARRLEGARITPVGESATPRHLYEPSIVSDTLAEILVAQGAYGEAMKAFMTLARSRPERLTYYEERIAEMKRRIVAERGDEE